MAKIRQPGVEGAEQRPQGVSLPEISPAAAALAQQVGPPESAPPFQIGADGRQDQFPRVVAQAPFFLVCNPDRWDVMDDKLVPILQRLSGIPGVNGVTRGAGGRPGMAMAIASANERGLIVIPHDVDGPGRSYLRSWQVGWQTDRRTKQTFPLLSWHTRWETLYQGSEAITSDEAGYVAWVDGLVQRGALPRPPPYVFGRLEAHYIARIATYRGKANGNHPLVAEYERRLAVVRAARDGAPPKPATPIDAQPELA